MLNVVARTRAFFVGKGSLTWFGDRYPALDGKRMSSIPGLYVIGNISGTPDFRAALNGGSDVGRSLASEPDDASQSADHDVVIVGAGPAGLACAAELAKTGNKSFVVLERKRTFATLRAFKPDLPLYNAVTGDPGNHSVFPYGDTRASELLTDWEARLADLDIPMREGVVVESVTRRDGMFHVELKGGETIRARRVVLALGKLVHLGKLGAADEKLDCRLVEHSISKPDEPSTSVECEVLARSGMRMERDLDGPALARLLGWVAAVLALYLWLYYGSYDSSGRHVVPFTGGRLALPGWTIYSTTYTALIWVFGIRAIRRWRHPLQTKKFVTLIACQTILFWGLPTYLFANIEGFGTPSGGYELAYIWPLAIKPEYTADWASGIGAGGWALWMFGWNMALSFVLVPLITYKHGKKYCSWVCGCGGLAETLGDSWRHYSPKGPQNTAREKQNLFVLGFALVATAVVVAHVAFPNVAALDSASTVFGRLYAAVVDVWLIAIVPVALYPFLGGKIWCRFWCPSAAYMHLWSAFWTRFKRSAEVVGRTTYGIFARMERCIACNMCSRYCEVGVDVKKFAIKGKTLDNTNSSCIGCGICISVCPTATLSHDETSAGQASTALS